MQLTNFKSSAFKIPLFKSSVIILVVSQFCSCGFISYQAKPNNPAENVAAFNQKNPNSPQFYEFLALNGHAIALPIQTWDLTTLIDCALFFNPSLDVARAKLKLADAASTTAAERPLPNLNATTSDSNQANNDISPFGLSLGIDLPFETANKRDIRIESARHLTNVAQLQIAQTAWQLRYQVTNTYYAIQYNQALVVLLTAEDALRKDVVAMYTRRVDAGMASNVELSIVNLQLKAAIAALNAQQQESAVLRAALASDLGLPIDIVNLMVIKADDKAILKVKTDDAVKLALLNRIDVRIALEQYAVAESKLKLAIAKQYPDLIVSPGYAYEFGDKVWSLGISGLLTLLNKNRGAIKEATQLREVEAAQFMSLQANVISEANLATAQFNKALQIFERQKASRDAQERIAASMQARFNLGDIDRVELGFNKIESVVADKNVALANHELNLAASQLENTVQRPLD